MAHYPYLIVGGGMTADAAAHGIRELDADRAIGVIAAEPHPPYNRPPLSKALWKGDAEDTIWRRPEPAGVTRHLERRVTAIDARAKSVTDDRGMSYSFDKLLLATGGTPRRLASDAGDVIYFRTLDDYRRLKNLAARPLTCAVIGGGFIGSEIAAALRMQGRNVTMLLPEAGLGARVFPADLSGALVDYYREKGVEVRAKEALA